MSMLSAEQLGRLIATLIIGVLVSLHFSPIAAAQNGDTLIRRLGPQGDEVIRRPSPRRNDGVVFRRLNEKPKARKPFEAPRAKDTNFTTSRIPGFEVFENADISGGDFASYVDATADYCASACTRAAQCTSFTHNVAKRVCFLKTGSGAPTRFAGAVSGRKVSGQQAQALAATLEPSTKFETLSDMDMPGSDLASYEKSSVDQCQAACALSAQCAAFTQNIEKAVCFLKSSSGKPKRFVGAISGRKLEQGEVAVAKAVERAKVKVKPSRSVPLFDIYDDAEIGGGSMRSSGLGFDEQGCINLCAGTAQCKAFTYRVNEQGGRFCDLKSEVVQPARAPGKVAAIKVPPPDIEIVTSKPKDGFTRHLNADVLAGSQSNGSAVSHASVDACQHECLMADGCQGFTYGENEPACRLKSVVAGSKETLLLSPMPDAVSGIKGFAADVAAARHAYTQTLPDVPSADLAWRKDDNANSFVTRIRAAARSMGASCEIERAKMQALTASLQATVRKRDAVVGEKVSVDWSVAGQKNLPPVWLMISVDGPVRFTASGFYALMPEAIAPFGLSIHADRTRALTTLFGKDDPNRSTVEILPMTAGVLNVSVRVIGYLRACEEEYDGMDISAVVTVAPSPTPIFLVRDPFTFDKPSKVWLSPAGDTKLEIFDGRFRLVDVASGAFLADREGTEPSYSPTGRFVSFTLGQNGRRLLDAVDGAMIADLSNTAIIGWENNDSFLVDGWSGLGGIYARSLLVEGAVVGNASDCRVCSGRGELYMLDLENDVIHGGSDDPVAQRLSGLRTVSNISGSDASSLSLFVAEQTNSAPISSVVRWNMRGGLKFAPQESQALPHYQAGPSEASKEELDHMVRMEHLVASSDHQPASLSQIAIGQARGAIALTRPQAVSATIKTRLADFGLKPTPDSVAGFSYTHPDAGLREGIGDINPAIAKKVQDSVPGARGAFAASRDTAHCNPDEAAPNGLEQMFPIFDTATQYVIGERTIWLTFYACIEGSGAIPYPNLHFFDSAYDKGFLRIDEDGPPPNGGNIGTSSSSRGCTATAIFSSGRPIPLR